MVFREKDQLKFYSVKRVFILISTVTGLSDLNGPVPNLDLSIDAISTRIVIYRSKSEVHSNTAFVPSNLIYVYIPLCHILLKVNFIKTNKSEQ